MPAPTERALGLGGLFLLAGPACISLDLAAVDCPSGTLRGPDGACHTPCGPQDPCATCLACIEGLCYERSDCGCGISQQLLDQANLATGSYLVTGPALSLGQTFVALAGGELMAIAVAANACRAGPGDQLRLTLARGPPGQGVSIASAALPAGAMYGLGGCTQELPASLDDDGGGGALFDLRASCASLTPGGTYHLLLSGGASGACGPDQRCSAGRVGRACHQPADCDSGFVVGINADGYATGTAMVGGLIDPMLDLNFAAFIGR